ncbi:cardiolipin synthase [Lactobacillus hominis]|uniref:Cardiolipin synthase n=1 Tax=Lactobacillus hominis DSM 23910 = CRBIP 24.179 TaxID=1423758 RepID=I7IV96_9LACO|nr:cardiolipin synthase [Lactobacillus hominis]KRM85987.1 cardiolipin synthetase [Lactobacillus hominis DSM 23910 = CRBIP 24.179]MCT3348787.1 cardiolipin synthase [Lactobacillus hominis]CCI81058.1 Cardiolipin synthetase [Lactobacillus hominis DSM 23910 = CRBIP 24.179]
MLVLTWDMVRRIVEILWIINVIFAVWTVFRSHRDIASTWAWLLVLIGLPYIGFILYLLVGRQLSHDKIFIIKQEQEKIRDHFLKQQRQMLDAHDLLPSLDQNMRSRRLVELNLNNDDAILTIDNSVETFIDGPKLFDNLIDNINQAKDTINIEFYTFYADSLGKRVLAALEKAAQRKVNVRVLYDTSGSHGTKPSFFNKLRELGGLAQPFISDSSNHWYTTPRYNYHLHRKLVIIDHKIGYIGGFNIGDQYVDQSKKFGHWRDTHLRVVGQSAAMMEVRFTMDWNTSCRKSHVAQIDIDDEIKNFKLDWDRKDPNSVAMQIVASGPDNANLAIQRGYEEIIAQAQKYVYIQTPYLIPGDPILESLVIASKSGVDVRIMIPCMADHPFVYRATEYYAKYLTKQGLKIYKYDSGFIHAKTMVSGSDIASVGSANQDFRSYRLNFEVNAFCYSPQLTKELKEIFEKDIEESTLLTNEYFDQQSKWRKFKQYFSRLLSPIL